MKTIITILCFLWPLPGLLAQSGSCGVSGVYINFEDYVNYDRATGGDLEIGPSGDLELGPMGRYDVYGALINNGKVQVDSGAVLSVYGDVTNNAVFILHRYATVHFYGRTWKNDPSATVSDGDPATNTVPGGVLNFTAFRPDVPADWIVLSPCLTAYSGGNAVQYADGGDVPMDAELHLNNANNVVLVNTTARIEGKLSWDMPDGDIVLGDQDLVFTGNATQAGYQADRFAITSGFGHVVKENYTGNWIFPVGIRDRDYTPAAIENTTPNTMHVLVQDYASSASDEGPGGADGDGMDRTWNIYAANPAATATITLQHNSVTNQPLFDDAYNFVTRWGSVAPNPTGDYTVSFSMSAWQTNYAAMGTIGNLSSTGIVAGSNMRSRVYHDFAVSATAPEAYFSKSSDPSHPLPVQLISFTAVARACAVLVEFKTGQENSIAQYRVLRSSDGLHYSVVATLEPKGHNSTYSYLDKDAPEGVNIYRLVMAEPNGDYTNSPSVSVHVDCPVQKPVLVLYPNPAGDQVTLSGMLLPSEIRIIDMWGRVLMALSSTAGKEVIDISQLAAATYTVKVISARNEVADLKFQKL